MTTLADRVEAAGKGSRELDAEIDHLLGWRRVDNPTSAGGLIDLWRWPDGTMSRRSEAMHRYTTSINAALTLVLDGWSSKLYIHPEADAVNYAEVYKLGDIIETTTGLMRPYAPGGSPVEAEAATPALALCAAALRARQTSGL